MVSAQPVPSTSSREREARLSLYGAVIGLVLACRGVERTQVMRMLELVNSVGVEPLGTLLAFISYQGGRGQIHSSVVRLLGDCLLNLKKELGSVSRDDLLRCFSMVKWVYTSVSQAFRGACRRLNIYGVRSCSDLLSRFNSVDELLATILTS